MTSPQFDDDPTAVAFAPEVDEPGDPGALDTGDAAGVDPGDRDEVDDPTPMNDDAGDALDDVDEGEIVDLERDEVEAAAATGSVPIAPPVDDTGRGV